VLELLRQRASIRGFTIEESATCSIHGEDFIEKLVDGQYTFTMVDRGFDGRTRLGCGPPRPSARL
jgi:hypothetical protein